ncbi:copper transporter [Rhodotorula toruloides]|uniref:Copper transport protein n=1 Tax=Rhodotorula toruloides TaxID=5286 RepID=A0A511KJ86_RHOTO|nr:copper transporter [Rhodotorula toruloides]
MDPLQQISMLWNWTTTGACFLSPQWRIRSTADYIGTLIGIFSAVVLLELVRRLAREYDRSIRAAYYRREERALSVLGKKSGDSAGEGGSDEEVLVPPFRPTARQHLFRTTFYLIQFSTSYILMLLAMYFNGGVIFAIFAGGATGYGLFARDTASDLEGEEGARILRSRRRDEAQTGGECCC